MTNEDQPKLIRGEEIAAFVLPNEVEILKSIRLNLRYIARGAIVDPETVGIKLREAAGVIDNIIRRAGHRDW